METSSTPILHQRRGIIMPSRGGIRMVLCVHCLNEHPADKQCGCDESVAEREALDHAAHIKK